MYVRKLPSGKFNCVVRHPSGRRLSFTDPLRRVVVEWGNRKEAEFRGGAPAERARKVTVAAWCERWLASRRVEPATAAKDRSQLRTHVLPRWGDWPLSSITRSEVQSWVTQMTHAGVGASTVTGAYHRFAAMMSDAVLEGLLPVTPCREIDLPRVVKPEPRWLTRLEYDRVQLALAVSPQGQVWSAFAGLGCFSGLRPGELAGLDVGHVDVDRRLVSVRQVMTRHGMRAYPKSHASVRAVPFPPEVADLLWPLVADRSSGPLFTSSMGQRVSETNFRNRVWRPALTEAGIGYVRPYVMRHTAASWLVQAGVPPIEIVRMLGHSSMALVNTYLHLAPDQHDRIRQAWEILDPPGTHAENEKSPTRT